MSSKRLVRCPLCKRLCLSIPHSNASDLADLRKEFAKILRQQGYSYRQICKIVGWKSPRTAFVQTQASSRVKVLIGKQLEEFLST